MRRYSRTDARKAAVGSCPASEPNRVILTDPGGPKALGWARDSSVGTIAAVAFLTVGSLWYGFLSFVAWRWPEVVRDGYAPLAPGFHRRKSLLGSSLLYLMIFFACASLWVAAVRHHWRDLETPGPSSPIPGSPR